MGPRSRRRRNCCFSTSPITPRWIWRFARRGSTPAPRLSPRWSTRCCATWRAPGKRFSPVPIRSTTTRRTGSPSAGARPTAKRRRGKSRAPIATSRRSTSASRATPRVGRGGLAASSFPPARFAWTATRRSTSSTATPTASGGCRTPPPRLPARLIGAGAGMRVVDLCAAPGGKSAELAIAGASVTAVDRSAERLKRLAANFERLRLARRNRRLQRPQLRGGAVRRDADRRALHGDRDDPPPSRRRLDQAPGRPAGARRAAEPAHRQGDRADQAGRRIVYCTCSLEPEEGEGQIAALLRRNPDVRRMPIEARRNRRSRRMRQPGRRLAHPALPLAGSRRRASPASTASSPRGCKGSRDDAPLSGRRRGGNRSGASRFEFLGAWHLSHPR